VDIETVGSSAGSGLLAAVLTWIGFKQRLDAVDKKMEILAAAVVYKDTHDVCSCSWHMSLEALNKKLDYIIGRLDK